MGACGGVDAVGGQTEALDRLAVDQMLLNDCGDIFGLNISVPDRFWINHDYRPVLALVEAAGLVDADCTAQAGRAGKLLQLSEHLALTVSSAGWAWGTLGADILTDKDVPFKGSQWAEILLLESYPVAATSLSTGRDDSLSFPFREAKPHLRQLRATYGNR